MSMASFFCQDHQGKCLMKSLSTKTLGQPSTSPFPFSPSSPFAIISHACLMLSPLPLSITYTAIDQMPCYYCAGELTGERHCCREPVFVLRPASHYAASHPPLNYSWILHDSQCGFPWSRRFLCASDKPISFPSGHSLPLVVAAALHLQGSICNAVWIICMIKVRGATRPQLVSR